MPLPCFSLKTLEQEAKKQEGSAWCLVVQIYQGKDGNAAKVAVAGLSLVINKQECFGLLGPNGAGKTTTIKVCTGLSSCSMERDR